MKIVLLILILLSSHEKIHFTEMEFAEVSDFIISEDGIYIADSTSSRIYFFNRQGELVSRAGSRGRGPGEYFMGPNQILKVGEKIYVFDKLPNALNIYDYRLNLLNVIVERDIFMPAYHAFQYADSIMYLASSPIYGQILGKYSVDGGLISEIEIDNLHKMGSRDRFQGFVADSSFTLIWEYVNRIDTYSVSGELTNSCRIESLPEEVDYQIEHFDFPGENMTKEQFELFSKGIYLPSGYLISSAVKAGPYFMVQYGNLYNEDTVVVINNRCEILFELPLSKSKKLLYYDYPESTLYYSYESNTKIGFQGMSFD